MFHLGAKTNQESRAREEPHSPMGHHNANQVKRTKQKQNSNLVPRNLAIPLHLQKNCFFLKAAPFFAEKGHCSVSKVAGVWISLFW